MPRDDLPPLARPVAPHVGRDADDGVPVRRRLRAARPPWLVPAVAVGGVLVGVLAVGAFVLLKGRGGAVLPDWHGMRWNESELLAHLSNSSGETWYHTEQQDWPNNGLNQFIHDRKFGDGQNRSFEDAIKVARADDRADRRARITGFEDYLWYDWGRFAFTSLNRPMMEKLKRLLPGGTGNI